MVGEEPKESLGDGSTGGIPVKGGQVVESLFSPRFKSVAAMAGWDEEAIIVASLIVEDTPDRGSKCKKRSDLQFKTPPSSNSRRKRRAKRSPLPLPVVINLDEIEKEENNKKSVETEADMQKEKKREGNELPEQNSGASGLNPSIPCMDKLREELSCAICLEICFEPSTTSCGHSFCKKCLRSAADKCGKRCPKCRQLISNGRSCTVNTVLWNTIQLLFPQEVEARKAASGLSPKESNRKSAEREILYGGNGRSTRLPFTSSSRDASTRRGMPSQQEEDRFRREDLSRLLSNRGETSARRRRGTSNNSTPSQDEDAALALRLQREEFMEAFNDQPRRRSLSLARANLRAMASRAVQIRRGGQSS